MGEGVRKEGKRRGKRETEELFIRKETSKSKDEEEDEAKSWLTGR